MIPTPLTPLPFTSSPRFTTCFRTHSHAYGRRPLLYSRRPSHPHPYERFSVDLILNYGNTLQYAECCCIEIRDAGPTSVQEIGDFVANECRYKQCIYDYIRYLHLSSTRTRNVGYLHQRYAQAPSSLSINSNMLNQAELERRTGPMTRHILNLRMTVQRTRMRYSPGYKAIIEESRAGRFSSRVEAHFGIIDRTKQPNPVRCLEHASFL